jgi:hypothetical protein
VRQRLVREQYAPLIRAKSVGAVKLDLLLRCVGFSPEHLGERQTPGFVRYDFSYEALHDLIKEQPEVRTDGERDEVRERKLKRKWVADQLKKLEQRQLVKVTQRTGKRSQIVVLRDDGSGEPYDDPGTALSQHDDPSTRPDPYFTLTGGLFTSGELKTWGAPEIAMYFAALLAELHHPRGGRPPMTSGRGTWFRPLRWFNDGKLQPANRTLLPFSVTTLELGLAELRRRKLITALPKMILDPSDPNPWSHFNQPRNIYTDHFNRMERDFKPLGAGAGAGAQETPAIVAEVPTVADQLLAGLQQAAAETAANTTSG